MNTDHLLERIEKLKHDAIGLIRDFQNETGLIIKLSAESHYNKQNGTQFFLADTEINIKTIPKTEQ